MNVADFNFQLPEELIAQEPSEQRGNSRLLVLSRASGAIQDAAFRDLGNFLQDGDLLVLNNTKVFPARLRGRRVPTGGQVECLLVQEISSGVWEALMHPGQKMKPGAQVLFERDGVRLHGEVMGRHFHGRRTIRLWSEGEAGVRSAIDQIGHIPLPPYIRRDDRPQDRERYQTVYARDRGSVAAPTAGLHFTDALLAAMRSAGVQLLEITLHVGYGTFKPVRSDTVADHVVDAEAVTVAPDAADTLTAAHRAGRRIIAVGTTTTRALESLQIEDGRVLPVSGRTDLFIRPGHRFQLVSGLVTNFHLPRSSLLMLVAAFAGRERVLTAYRHAVSDRYRFYSYGDAMLIV
jgi:S-adenosylmethionine:tRNA ribosyltransferase-isomerase